MAINYTSILATAQRLINANGRTVSVIRLSRALDDAGKPWRGTANPRTTPDATQSLKGVFVSAGSATDLGFLTEVPETIALEHKFMITAAVTGVELEDYDEVVDDSKYYKIVRCQKLQPGDTALLYFFELENLGT